MNSNNNRSDSAKQLAKGISGIVPGPVSITDFCVMTNTGTHVARNILKKITSSGIGTRDLQGDEEWFHFDETDKIKAGILAISKGAAIEEVSKHLEWKDFEALTGEILEAREFETEKNVYLSKPKMEIDVVGIKQGVAILIDCKHWKRTAQSFSSMEGVVKKQKERTKHFLESRKDAKMAIPAVVTLYDDGFQFIENVPVVPINKLGSFCDEFYEMLDSKYGNYQSN